MPTTITTDDFGLLSVPPLDIHSTIHSPFLTAYHIEKYEPKPDKFNRERLRYLTKIGKDGYGECSLCSVVYPTRQLKRDAKSQRAYDFHYSMQNPNRNKRNHAKDKKYCPTCLERRKIVNWWQETTNLRQQALAYTLQRSNYSCLFCRTDLIYFTTHQLVLLGAKVKRQKTIRPFAFSCKSCATVMMRLMQDPRLSVMFYRGLQSFLLWSAAKDGKVDNRLINSIRREKYVEEDLTWRDHMRVYQSALIGIERGTITPLHLRHIADLSNIKY